MGEGRAGVWKELPCVSAECEVSQELRMPTALLDMIPIVYAHLTANPEPLISMTCPLDLVRVRGWGAGWSSGEAAEPEAGRPHPGG